MSLEAVLGILFSGIRLATPYLFAALGETLGQLSGVLNLGVEGVMLLGAYSAYYVTFRTGDPWLGLLAAIALGLVMGLLIALINVTLKAEQGISGIGVFMFGLGLSDLLFQKTIGSVQAVVGFQPVHIPLLSDLPVVGPLLFQHNVLVYAAFLLVPLLWFLINKTTWGLKVRAVGQNPAAADALGISVTRVRYSTCVIGGVLSSIAGASLSIALLNVFQQNLTSGMGFIAVALVYFGGWSPVGAMWGSLLFSMVNALQLWIQILGIPIPADFATMLPYILTIVVLIFSIRRVEAPAALNKIFERGES
jgi:simple sugar transport system permease protein